VRRLAACCITTLAFAGSAIAATPVNSLVLKPAQIGPGYGAHLIPGGNKVVDQVTLDLCKTHYATEALRVRRIQLAYVKSGTAVRMSNEVVRYRAGGAAKAMTEMRSAIAHCPTHPIAAPEAGLGLITYRLTRLRPAGLLPGAIALRVRAKASGGSYDTVAIYQTRGDVLSGVYAAGGTFAARRSLALHAAAQSAKNLRHD
jgi:hypothetical protein